MDYVQMLGETTELQCISKFVELGYHCSIPYGNFAKYDFIADVNGKLLRIQCKSASNPKKANGEYDKDAFLIHSVSTNIKKNAIVRHSYSKDCIDYFATYYDGQVYLIPVEECKSGKILRLKKTKNNQPYNDANQYRIENVLPEAEEITLSRLRVQNEYNKMKPIYHCAKCKTAVVSENGKLCRKCSFEETRVAQRPTRETLKNLIRTKGFVEVSKIYGVTDNSIRSWCRTYGLPSHRSYIKKLSDKEWEKL